jgi:hypothetical protein
MFNMRPSVSGKHVIFGLIFRGMVYNLPSVPVKRFIFDLLYNVPVKCLMVALVLR